MSQPFSRYLHPFDPARPSYEPEVNRALLTSWNRDRRTKKRRPCESGSAQR